jgi:hypothetical protein
MRRIGTALLPIVSLVAAAHAIAAECPLPGQHPMMRVEFFFGRSIGDRGFVHESAWRAFERDVVARDFPGGFTVLHADGNWRDAHSGAMRKERSELVVIVMDDSEAGRAKIGRVAAEYKRRFRQDSIGIFTTQGCGAF